VQTRAAQASLKLVSPQDDPPLVSPFFARSQAALEGMALVFTELAGSWAGGIGVRAAAGLLVRATLSKSKLGRNCVFSQRAVRRPE
jgi:hypothetical protein